MKKTLEGYKKDATRTESLIDSVNVDPQLLAATMQIMIAAGTILDQIKKHTFYDKAYKTTEMVGEFHQIVQSLDVLKEAITNLDKFGTVATEQETAYNPRIFHAITGIATEAVELLQALGQPELDQVNILEESFDVDWYQFILMDETNKDLEQVWITGFDKLRKRFPEKFTSEDAINRDTSAEREILDETLKD